MGSRDYQLDRHNQYTLGKVCTFYIKDKYLLVEEDCDNYFTTILNKKDVNNLIKWLRLVKKDMK